MQNFKKCKKIFLKKLFSFAVITFLTANIYSQEQLYSLEFEKKNITDIAESISAIIDKTLRTDETVDGSTNFYCEELSAKELIKEFAEQNRLYAFEINGGYELSRAKITVLDANENAKVSVHAENVQIQELLTVLSRKTLVTILFDQLPKTYITLHEAEITLAELLNIITLKLPGFTSEQYGKTFYINRNANSSTKRNVDFFTLTQKEGLFSLAVQKSQSKALIDALFKKANAEYALFSIQDATIENLNYEQKEFDDLLSLVLCQINMDFSKKDGIYCIFEIQRKDVLKKLKELKIIKLKHITTEEFVSILPAELSTSSFFKTQNSTNSVILHGSHDELLPIESFIKKVDIPSDLPPFRKIELKHSKTDTIAPHLKNLAGITELTELSSKSILTFRANETCYEQAKNLILALDKPSENFKLSLKFITPEIFLSHIPSYVLKEDFSFSPDGSTAFFSGSKGNFERLLTDISLIDKPSSQITYQILVLQRQKTASLNQGSTFSVNSIQNTAQTEGRPWITHSSVLSNVFGINFDIISKFGLQFAGTLNAELSEGKSRVLADTTLNAVSGETVTFSNTNTYRYRDIIVNTGGDLYTSTTREISSGLTLNLNGWVSGDGMISVKIDAQVSKQGSSDSTGTDTSNPPSTSEKKVSANVRTKSGEPVIIGGLFQQETDVTEKRVPILGSIPLLGNLFKSKSVTNADTEFVIYLVPSVLSEKPKEISSEKQIKRLYEKYILNKTAEKENE